MSNSYTAIDIANFIILQCNIKNLEISHLQLQKLLYYVAAKYAKETNELLFKESISKWQFGPVVKTVYHHFKIFGNKKLTPQPYLSPNSNYSGEGQFIIEFVKIDEINDKINNEEHITNAVHHVIKEYGALNPFHLVGKTHKEQAWKSFEDRILQGEELTYSIEELKGANI